MAETQFDHPHRCLGCGYSLTGLPDPPRCPECGLLNIPDGLRKQVWELVDSGKWFFSSMFGPFKKRLPGWWWALDREEDVRRSTRFLVRNLAIMSLLLIFAGFVSGGLGLEQTDHYSVVEANDSDANPVYEIDQIIRDYLPFDYDFQTHDWTWSKPVEMWQFERAGRKTSATVSTRATFEISFLPFLSGAWHAVGVFLIWAGPGVVGIWTQIRKGLPEFALARRTIVAAVNHESHRLIYTTIVLVVAMGFDVVMRIQGVVASLPGGFGWAHAAGWAIALILGAAGWVGPLRSDFTGQLVRSRLHLVRIFVMYAVLLPLALTAAVAGLILTILSRSCM